MTEPPANLTAPKAWKNDAIEVAFRESGPGRSPTSDRSAWSTGSTRFTLRRCQAWSGA